MINWSTVVFLQYQTTFCLAEVGLTIYAYIYVPHFKWCLIIYCAFSWPSALFNFSEWAWRSVGERLPLQTIHTPLVRWALMDSIKETNRKKQFSFGWKRCFPLLEKCKYLCKCRIRVSIGQQHRLTNGAVCISRRHHSSFSCSSSWDGAWPPRVYWFLKMSHPEPRCPVGHN